MSLEYNFCPFLQNIINNYIIILIIYKYITYIISIFLNRKTRKIKKKIVRNATVLNDGKIIRVRREKSTDESDEECYTETSSEEENSEEENKDVETDITQEDPVTEKTPEPEGM